MRLVLRAITDLPADRRLVHLNLEVGDVDAAYQELKAKGVRFTYGPRVVNRGKDLNCGPPPSEIRTVTGSP
jgi:hypothetical protein